MTSMFTRALIALPFFVAVFGVPETVLAAVGENTRGRIIRDIVVFVVTEGVLVGAFYFVLYNVLLRGGFHHFVAHSVTVGLTSLYTICLLAILLLPYRLLDYWQWLGLFMLLGIAWLFLSIFLLVSSKR